MQKSVKIISVVALAFTVLTSPLMFTGGAFGLAGDTAHYYVLLWTGYIGVIIFSLISIFKYQFFPLVVISMVCIVIAVLLDTAHWKDVNSDLCSELRADSSCVETEEGFVCSDYENSGIGMTVPISICD